MTKKEVKAPFETRRIGRVYMHYYDEHGKTYVRFSYEKTGAVLLKDLFRHSILMSEMLEVIGGAFHTLLHGKRARKGSTPNPNYLDPTALQAAINSAFEPSEECQARLVEQNFELFTARLAKRAKRRGMVNVGSTKD